MFVCADDADAAAAPGIRHNGCCAYPADRERYWSPAMSCVDSFLDDRWPQNFCIGEAQCALGTEELKSVIANNNTLIEQDRKIREKLAGLPEISFSRCPENGRYVVHQYIMHYDGSACGKTRDDLLDLMTKNTASAASCSIIPCTATRCSSARAAASLTAPCSTSGGTARSPSRGGAAWTTLSSTRCAPA
ncbi:MAG: DegT/DnrJ/EryC1/StrS family aminotransferase [Acutalibacteraceae bacterium]